MSELYKGDLYARGVGITNGWQQDGVGSTLLAQHTQGLFCHKGTFLLTNRASLQARAS